MQSTSKRAAFTRHIDPDKFIEEDKRRRPHMPHRVAVLVLSTRGDSVFLVQPRIAVENGDPHVRVPPQHALLGSGTVRDTATLILRDALNRRVHRDDLTYIGSTHGNKYSAGRIQPYAKMIHWMGVQIPRGRQLFNPDSRAYGMGYWCTQNQLVSMEGVTMSDRKYMMTLQAILGYAALAETDLKLASTAGRLLEVA